MLNTSRRAGSAESGRRSPHKAPADCARTRCGPSLPTPQPRNITPVPPHASPPHRTPGTRSTAVLLGYASLMTSPRSAAPTASPPSPKPPNACWSTCAALGAAGRWRITRGEAWDGTRTPAWPAEQSPRSIPPTSRRPSRRSRKSRRRSPCRAPASPAMADSRRGSRREHPLPSADPLAHSARSSMTTVRSRHGEQQPVALHEVGAYHRPRVLELQLGAPFRPCCVGAR